MGLLNTLLLIGFIAIPFIGIAVSTYLVGTADKRKWIVYPIFSAICIAIFVFFKYSMNVNFLRWRQFYLMVAFYVPVVCSLMAFIAVPKLSIKSLKEHILPILSIFVISGVLLMVY
ncbi:hypothetical protein HMPREF3181_00584 [Parvimonas sp. KA00067]|uniref:Uncharacterized protein n=1 Tax=Parvimonas parva TaxID=2769485 RepID=A0ABS1C8B3_9FIRM|nr:MULTISPECIES: hypothetical protein [Parvimonas]KXB66694.1 hypothetical protein HMPREF3181_00584 [Parvimonas sp. KA00067]MBK1468316.1 hypothetical protein [Parvimonas parva]